MEKVSEDASLDFKWLKKRCIGGKKKDHQFYESFIYDGVEYMLYDCVYMHKEGLQEPYIGKLIKIWEQRDNKIKRIKVQWFFRPEEISNWLGDTKTLKNEIFFASGEGQGLSNINPLEVIAGKCNVVCVSKDKRNPQPSDEELKTADHVFYRTFDVKSCIILDKMDDKVGGLEIENVFNRKVGESTSDQKEENPKTTACGEATRTSILSLETGKPDKEDNILSPKVGQKNSEKGEVDRDKNSIPKNIISDKLDTRPLKKRKSFDKSPLTVKQVKLGAAVEDSERLTDALKKLKGEKSVNNLKASRTSGTNSDKIDNCVNKDSDKADKVEAKSDNLHDRPLKKIKVPKEKQVEDSGKLMDKSKVENSVKSPVDVKNGKVVLGSENGKSLGKVADDSERKMLNKTKSEGSSKMVDDKSNKSGLKLRINTNGINCKDNKEEPKVEESGERKKKVSVSKLSTEKDKKTKYQEIVVGPKPNADRNSWFTQLPWEERLENAYEQGTAILLYNVDPDYTSGEVEDLIWHALTEHCEAKVLQRTATSSPHYGQALILLKTKEAAQRVLTKLSEECLMLSNRRPLVATICPRILMRKKSNFHGHLAIDKIRVQNQREDEAVSTSHFSQPNTIEYDMAMEWSLLQSRSKKWWDMIHKQQGDELGKLTNALVKK